MKRIKLRNLRLQEPGQVHYLRKRYRDSLFLKCSKTFWGDITYQLIHRSSKELRDVANELNRHNEYREGDRGPSSQVIELKPPPYGAPIRGRAHFGLMPFDLKQADPWPAANIGLTNIALKLNEQVFTTIMLVL